MIVCFGDAIVDLFAHPRGADVSTAEQFVPHAGGAPANVATVCARMGGGAIPAIAAQSVMDDLIAPALAFSGLLIATGLYFLMIRRRGHDRRRRRADQWDREMSQARAVQRFESLTERDRHRPE